MGGEGDEPSASFPPSILNPHPPPPHQEEVLQAARRARRALDDSLDVRAAQAEELGARRPVLWGHWRSPPAFERLKDELPRRRRRHADARRARRALFGDDEARPIGAAVDDATDVRPVGPRGAEAGEAAARRKTDGPDKLVAVILGPRVNDAERVDDEAARVERDRQPRDKPGILWDPGRVRLRERGRAGKVGECEGA